MLCCLFLPSCWRFRNRSQSRRLGKLPKPGPCLLSASVSSSPQWDRLGYLRLSPVPSSYHVSPAAINILGFSMSSCSQFSHSVLDLRSGLFFFPHQSTGGPNISIAGLQPRPCFEWPFRLNNLVHLPPSKAESYLLGTPFFHLEFLSITDCF